MKLNWKVLLGSAALIGAALYIIKKKKKSKDSDCKIYDSLEDLFVWDRPYKNADEEKDAMYAEDMSLMKEAKLINTGWSIIAKESITSDWIKSDAGGEYQIVWYELCSNTLTNAAYGKEDFKFWTSNSSYITGKIISKDGSVKELIKIKS